MIKKVTYTFLNTLLFDNKWRIKFRNVISSRPTHFSFAGALPAPSLIAWWWWEKSQLIQCFGPCCFRLPGRVWLLEHSACGQSILTKRCIPFTRANGRKEGREGGRKEFHFRLHLSSNCGPNRGDKILLLVEISWIQICSSCLSTLLSASRARSTWTPCLWLSVWFS